MLIIIVGPSGAGKSTVQNILQKNYNVKKIISTTTRNPREGEKNDVDYHFVSDDEFDKIDMIDKTIFRGNKYGLETTKISDAIEGINSIVLDGHGEFNIANYCYERGIPCKTVLLDSPTSVLVKRIMQDNDRNGRIGEKGSELEKEKSSFIYESFDNVIQTNDKSAETVSKIIYRCIPKYID